ncbi:MBL fold metallo-hydrolase [Nocardia rhizosphaerihabitans]|uniref:MBL fold metallo-hydrolase n=1 Tax=Nocardia rhizosphaerihabitans TaxID=1691570 RepID=UPI00366FD885
MRSVLADRTDISARLHEILVPTLILDGAEDRQFSRHHAQDLARYPAPASRSFPTPDILARANPLGDWIAGFDKNLTDIYATHGHGDHWFGTAALLERFPRAIPYATEGTIEVMAKNVQLREYVWDSDFPGLIPESPLIYRPIPEHGIDLEGHKLVPVEVIPTPPLCSTSPRSAWSSAATSSTTVFTRCCSKPAPTEADSKHGWPRWTSSTPSRPRRSSQATRTGRGITQIRRCGDDAFATLTGRRRA